MANINRGGGGFQNTDHKFCGQNGLQVVREVYICAPSVDARYWTVITAKRGRAIKLGEGNMATNIVRVNSVLTENIADCCAGMMGVRQN